MDGFQSEIFDCLISSCYYILCETNKLLLSDILKIMTVYTHVRKCGKVL